MIVLENLLEDIEGRKKKVDEQLKRTSLIGRLRNLFRTSIDEEANIHSCRMEYRFGMDYLNNKQNEDFEKWYAKLEENGKLDDVDEALNLADKMENCGDSAETGKHAKLLAKMKRKEFRECYRNLNDAWKWGLDNIGSGLSEKFIIEIAKRIKPGEVEDYRKVRVRPTGAPVSPPAPEKIPREMKNLMENIARAKKYIELGKMSPVEFAIMTHYHLARIHPFEDGNGRTSRLVQNLILHNYGYPATIIHKGDKMNYIMNLRKADEDHKWRDNNADFINGISEGERHFYDYLASRLNTSIDLILDKAYKTRKK